MNTFLRNVAYILVTLSPGPLFGQTLKVPAYTVTDLGTLPGTSSSEALALNDRGQVVGVCSTGGQGKAFLWQKGRMTPLPLLNGFGPLGLWPHAINNHGQIIGVGLHHGQRHAFLLTPR